MNNWAENTSTQLHSDALDKFLREYHEVEIDLEQPLIMDKDISSSNNQMIKKNSGKMRKRQKDELEYLQHKVDELTTHLDVIQQVKKIEAINCSPWESFARKQAADSHKATQENLRLKRALEEQLKIAETLKEILMKKPKLTVS